MKIFLDCLPCMLRQVLEASYMTTEDEAVRETIMDEAIKILADYKNYDCAPAMSEIMHNIIKKYTGKKDPYAKIKALDIEQSLAVEPLLQDYVSKGDLYKVLKTAAVGNIMDSALYSEVDVKGCLSEELEKPCVICDLGAFEKDLEKAKNVLIIADNAGEVVFDKVLVKHLSKKYKIFYALRESPIINDATVDDAIKTGIDEYCEILPSGCSMPGTVYEECSEAFKNLFNNADLVISKGQGNFEAMSDSKREVYFLLKAKCKRIAWALNVKVNDYVFKKHIPN